MEHEVLNEILTTTVGFLFDVNPCKMTMKSKDSKISNSSNDLLEKNSKNGPLILKNEGMREVEHKKKLEDLLDIWVINEGPKFYQESMKKLKLDLTKLNRKEMEKMSYERINIEKKKIKNELKNYDLFFKATFKRFPMKNEKEPMRPLYIYYKTIKELLLKQTQGLKKVIDEQKIPEKKETSSSTSNNNISKNNDIFKKISDLKKKREDLRFKFQKYHSEFWKNNNRKIKYAQDIAPIEQDYKLYKNIKEEIIKLENMIGN